MAESLDMPNGNADPVERRESERLVRLRRLLTQEVWPKLPPDQVGVSLTRNQADAILGYGVGKA